jgi:hypothetical protein
MFAAGLHVRPLFGLGRRCAPLVRAAAVWLLCMVNIGCAPHLKLTRLATASRPPSNVAVFFAADDDQGEPVVDLRAANLAIFEDGRMLAPSESHQTLLEPALAAEHHTLLLVDLSCSAMARDQRAMVIAGARDFFLRASLNQHIAVYAFDGGKALYEVVPFGVSAAVGLQALSRLQTVELRDPSTNLHGAVLQGLSELDRALRRAQTPLRFANLVVFTDGVDRADRVSARQMSDAVDATSHRVYTIGAGRELDDSVLSRIGKTGYIRVGESAALGSAFRELVSQIVRATQRYYLLSYCSSLRAGKHVVMLRARSAARVGELSYVLDAASFRAGCDARLAPSFAH